MGRVARNRWQPKRLTPPPIIKSFFSPLAQTSFLNCFLVNATLKHHTYPYNKHGLSNGVLRRMTIQGKFIINGADYSPLTIYGVGTFMAFSGQGAYINKGACTHLPSVGPIPGSKLMLMEK